MPPDERPLTIAALLAEWRRPNTPEQRKWAGKHLRRWCPGGLGTMSLYHGRKPCRWQQAVRHKLRVRDGGLRCSICGAEADAWEVDDWWTNQRWPSWLHVDHIVPLSHDGPHHIDNMRFLCAGCNGREYRAATQEARRTTDTDDNAMP